MLTLAFPNSFVDSVTDSNINGSKRINNYNLKKKIRNITIQLKEVFTKDQTVETEMNITTIERQTRHLNVTEATTTKSIIS